MQKKQEEEEGNFVLRKKNIKLDTLNNDNEKGFVELIVNNDEGRSKKKKNKREDKLEMYHKT